MVYIINNGTCPSFIGITGASTEQIGKACPPHAPIGGVPPQKATRYVLMTYLVVA
jgi:hypothetical protein